MNYIINLVIYIYIFIYYIYNCIYIKNNRNYIMQVIHIYNMKLIIKSIYIIDIIPN